MSDSPRSEQCHIVLLRHARPSYDTARVVRATELAAAIADYDASGIDPDCRHEAQARASTDETWDDRATLVASDLPRAIESARAFFPCMHLSAADPLYREAGLPSKVPMPISWIGLRFSSLAAVMRMLWVLGLPSNSETFREARERANQAARKLEELARRSGCAVLVGHGFQNQLIGRALKKNGWQTQSKQGSGYGASTKFSIEAGSARSS